MITSIVRSVFQNQFYRLTLLTFQKSHYLVQKMSSAAANGIRNERFSSQKVICLFDMDGTLTKSRQNIEHSMAETLHQLRKRVTIGVISGSDIGKIAEQLAPGQSLSKAKQALIDHFEYVFCENGLVSFHQGNRINDDSLLKTFGEDRCQELINFCLQHLSQIKLPFKRGNFIEFRSGMINVCPVGRSCSQEERMEFFKYDQQHKIREEFVAKLRERFPSDQGLQFAIGGQISIDIFPIGWDKTYCLQFLNEFDEIHFFGDRTDPGGNDHELYSHEKVIGHKVGGPEDTSNQLKKLFNL